MVLSRLDPSIDYSTNRALDPEDKDFDAWVYDTEIDGSPTVIALGQAKYTYVDDNIIYFPAYLVEDGLVTCQIGVYEVLADQLPNKLDADGALDLSELGEPLLYGNDPESAATPPVMSAKPDTEQQENLRSSLDSDVDDPDDIEESIPPPDASPEELATDELSAAELEEEAASREIMGTNQAEMQEDLAKVRSAYKPNPSAPWVQNFMRDAKYDIVDNEGGGDCLFAAIRDALQGVGKSVSVASMREMLASAVDSDLLENYTIQYMSAVSEEKDLTREIRELASRHRELKKRLAKASLENKSAIVLEAENIGDRHTQAKVERQAARDLKAEFAFMKGIDTIEAFKAIIQTCEFWGDTWALSTLERLLKIKLILFSEAAYDDGDTSNVLTCGQLNDRLIEEQGTFEPEFYVLLSYSGDHYQRITFDGATAFTFATLPLGVKELVVDKCLERAAGPYYIIPDFRALAESTGDAVPSAREIETSGKAVLQFYHASSGKARPGRGSGESMGNLSPADLRPLEAIKDWRKLLSDDGTAPIRMDGRNYKSVQHYVQAQKFTEGAPEFAKLFSLDSKSKLSDDPRAAKAIGDGKHTSDLLKKLGIDAVPSKDANAVEKGAAALKGALDEKFKKGTDAARALVATGNAELKRFIPRKKPELATDLMNIRGKLGSAIKDISD